MASLFSLEEATDELYLGASSAPVIQAAAIAAAYYYRMREERSRQRSGSAIDESSGYERKGGRDGGRYSLPPIPNGPITTSIHLRAVLHYFAGGSPYDIMCMFGIAYSEVLSSVWIVADVVNPETLKVQRKIAAGFEAASTPGIWNCAGAIDGFLIWILKPSLKEAKKAGIDHKKFLCGQKHKYGLNCQAVLDCRGHIIDISIKNCGASSDCMAFEASDLHKWLENGLMHQDANNKRFVLFGYLKSSYMETPFTNVGGDPNKAAGQL
ncbi:hypothetical protein ACHAW5_005972 [Stephanodiscus triporus]|uniref:DDE Tnp4 domain-containing protein n=1 Tax=Stephanodiscus triporus TaxID=2934178 RepID=A0ABD3MIC9_9STRA